MHINELTDRFLAWCSRHRAPATVGFYRTRLKKFREQYNGRALGTLTPLEIDEHLALAGAGLSDSTRHHNCVALERLQKFALEHKLLDQPVFGKLEKPRVGQRDRVPTADETAAILALSSPEFRLIYSALRQCGARPGELCRATIADIDRTGNVIVLQEHKTFRKTGKPRRIPIGRLCGRPHNRPYVVKSVMWRRPERSAVSSIEGQAKRHISYRATGCLGTASVLRFPFLFCTVNQITASFFGQGASPLTRQRKRALHKLLEHRRTSMRVEKRARSDNMRIGYVVFNLQNLRKMSACNDERPHKAGSWGNCSHKPSGNANPGRSSCPRPAQRGVSRISAGRIPGSGIWPDSRGIWFCTWRATNAGQKSAGRRGSNTPGDCWGTRISRLRSGTCTSMTANSRTRRIW
jgi:hypothetical protein